MNQPTLTSRWTPLNIQPIHAALWNSPHRFNVVPAGRRAYKTELCKRKLILTALHGTRYPGARFFAAAPTRDQAKRIFWDDLKALSPPHAIAGKPSESELRIDYTNGSKLFVLGMDKPARFEGSPWDYGVLDEYGDMKPIAWSNHVRPGLADRQGRCDLIGVPEGRNHYYDLYQYACAQMRTRGAQSEWGAYHWTSAAVLSPAEIESYRRGTDPLTFEQEFEANFINFVGRVYYPFIESTHCARLNYDPKQPLILMFDFNVAPGVAAIGQEMMLPNGLAGTGIIGEVWIPHNSSTPAVCRKIAADWGSHQGRVICYGDASGGAKGSAKVSGSDWDLIKAELRPVFGGRVSYDVPAANPAVRSRINAVNTRLMNGAGDVRLMVDPAKAPHVQKDFEGVRFLEGGAGDIDKKHDPDLTHISDSVGYYVHRKFPINSQRPAEVGIGIY